MRAAGECGAEAGEGAHATSGREGGRTEVLGLAAWAALVGFRGAEALTRLG